MWGWSVHCRLHAANADVFPTYVGMVRTICQKRAICRSFPHVCGDGPSARKLSFEIFTFSPRMWGWSKIATLSIMTALVFPTYVGMVRFVPGVMAAPVRFPHVCGDGPVSASAASVSGVFSPRMWGWSGVSVTGTTCSGVFPTYVGMVRAMYRQYHVDARFPHVCGDGPFCTAFMVAVLLFSPRMWGWSVVPTTLFRSGSVFPTYVGMVR